MKKKMIVPLLTAAMTMAMSMTAFAWSWPQVGYWHSTENGWQWIWYSDYQTTTKENGWEWIDGDSDGTSECYYFKDFYLLTNTTTPEGYTVNENGAWTVDGVVQTQPTDWNSGNIKPLGGAEPTTTKLPIMDADEIEQIIPNQELLNWRGEQNSLNHFPDKQIIGDGTWGPSYTASYRGVPIEIRSDAEKNSVSSYFGTVRQCFDNFPEQGIEMSAFFESTGFGWTGGKTSYGEGGTYTSTGNSDAVFGLPRATYRLTTGYFGEGHGFTILLTGWDDNKWIIYPDSKITFY